MLPVVKDLTSTARFLASGLLMMAMLSAVAALSGHACPGRLTVTSTRTFTAYPFGSAATTDTANNLLPLATSIAGIYTDYSSSNQPEGPGGYQNAYPTTGPVDSGQTQEQGEAGRQEISETTAKADPPAFGIEVTKPWSPTVSERVRLFRCDPLKPSAAP